MSRVSDITDTEMWILETTLRERYGTRKEYQVVDTDIRLNSSDRELTECPALYWEHEDCHFIIIKTGDKRYRAQFFYRGHEQFGTGISEYDDLSECVVSLLQTQADHEVNRRKESELS
jgi:hypothetical protein